MISLASHRPIGAVMTAVLMFLLLLGGCKKDDGPVAPPATPPAKGSWELVWADEFDGPSVDLTKWSYEVNGNGGGNNELQYYTARPENSFIANGCLVIQALQENYQGKAYTSARMRTVNKGDWLYGRFDIRARLPYGQGLWPAIWMLPTDWVYGGWPMSGEIDIMELLGQNPWKIYGTIHYGSSVQNHQQSGGSFSLATQRSFSSDFHVFSIEWDSLGITWYVDSVRYYSTLHGPPFDKRFHILLNVAVGGNWPGNPDASTTFPQAMEVDYVRVYRRVQ